METSRFYDDLADYYELIYSDWEASMARQGQLLANLLRARGPTPRDGSFRVLDVAAGIGTQALPLASLGFNVTARDLSPAAIARLQREARARNVSVDAAPADMRDVARTVVRPFSAVIACDNSLPHLLNDADILGALRSFRDLLGAGGLLLISLRDYDRVERGSPSHHPYGERVREGRRFRLGQHWTWLDSSRYRTTLVVEEFVGTAWREILSTSADYYAIPVGRVLELMVEAGFVAAAEPPDAFFQPLLIGRCAG
jgi:SAM-dependent methyltransferase